MKTLRRKFLAPFALSLALALFVLMVAPTTVWAISRGTVEILIMQILGREGLIGSGAGGVGWAASLAITNTSGGEAPVISDGDALFFGTDGAIAPITTALNVRAETATVFSDQDDNKHWGLFDVNGVTGINLRLFAQDLMWTADDDTDMQLRNKADSGYKRVNASGFLVDAAGALLDSSGLDLLGTPVLWGTALATNDLGLRRAGSGILQLDDAAGGAGVLIGPSVGTGLVIGIAGGSSGTGSALQVVSMTTTERGYLTAAAGMVIFNSTTGALEVYNGSSWGNVLGGWAASLLVDPTSGGTNVQISAGDSLIGDSTSTISFPGTGARTERFGSGADTSTFTDATAIGNAASITAASGTATGASSSAGGFGTANGALAVATVAGNAIGWSTSAIGNRTGAYGVNVDVTSAFAIGIGNQLAWTTANAEGSFWLCAWGDSNGKPTGPAEFCVGSSNTNGDVDIFYLGEGRFSPNPEQITLSGTEGTGPDITGSDMRIQPGRGTGAGTEGKFMVYTPVAHGSDSVLQTQIKRFQISSEGLDFGTEILLAGSSIGTTTVGLKRNADNNWVTTNGAADSDTVAMITSRVCGSISIAGGSLALTTTPAVYDQGTTTVWALNQFTVNEGGNGRLTYTGTPTISFEIDLVVSGSLSAGVNDSEWSIAIDGSTVATTEVPRSHSASGGDNGAIVTTYTVSLSTGQYVEAFVASASATPTWTGVRTILRVRH